MLVLDLLATCSNVCSQHTRAPAPRC